jgi:hypothetical protein
MFSREGRRAKELIYISGKFVFGDNGSLNVRTLKKNRAEPVIYFYINPRIL